MTVALLAAVLLAGCSGGGGDDSAPAPTAVVSVAPSWPRTPPPISPRTISSAPDSSLSPANGGGVPVPADPQTDR